MRLIDKITSSEQRVMQNPWGDWGPGDPGAMVGGSTWAGTHVNSTSALQLLTVYGCNRFICEGISTLPVDTFRKVGDESHPIGNPRWLEQPTATLDRVSWLTQILTSVLLSGNAYLHLTYKDGQLDQLIPLDPSKVKVERPNGRLSYVVAGERMSSIDVLHIPGVMLPGSDIGMSPVEAARQSIGLGLATTKYGAQFFDGPGNMPGVIEAPNDIPPESASAMARAWRKFRREGGNGLPGVLTGGAHWVATGVTNDQAQFLATRGYTSAEIAGQMFLIDPTEFGLDFGNGRGSITYANLEQRNARKVQVTFLPWLVRLERAFSGLLAQPRFVKFNVDALMRGDTKTQAESFAIATGNKPWQKPSEVRKTLDMAPMPGIDDAPPPPTPPIGGMP